MHVLGLDRETPLSLLVQQGHGASLSHLSLLLSHPGPVPHAAAMLCSLHRSTLSEQDVAFLKSLPLYASLSGAHVALTTDWLPEGAPAPVVCPLGLFGPLPGACGGMGGWRGAQAACPLCAPSAS